MLHIKAVCRLSQATTTLRFQFVCQVRTEAIHCACFSWNPVFLVTFSEVAPRRHFSTAPLTYWAAAQELKKGWSWSTMGILLQCEYCSAFEMSKGMVDHHDFMLFPALVENTCLSFGFCIVKLKVRGLIAFLETVVERKHVAFSSSIFGGGSNRALPQDLLHSLFQRYLTICKSNETHSDYQPVSKLFLLHVTLL